MISLLHKILRSPIAENGTVKPSEIETSQGAPVSSTLANILLNELDHELEKRGHRFVRYADAMMIFCKSKRAAERTLENLRPYIEGKLFLKINEQKTKVSHIADFELKFLGFGFWRSKEGFRSRPHQKSMAKCKLKLKELTPRSRGQSLNDFRKKLREFICGWVNYFKKASMKKFVRNTDGWLRRLIRQTY